MRILVTGGAGFIGSNLIRLLVSYKHEVLNVDALTYAGNLASLSDIEAIANYHFLKADICDAEAIRQAFADFRPDAVMHLAAESHVDRSIDGPGAFIQTNILGTYTLLEAARQHWNFRISEPKVSEREQRALSETLKLRNSAFRFLHVSTDEVYGSLGETGLFTESTSYDPHSPYSASKASSDHLVRAWADTYGLPTLITNCSNNYGPNQFPEKLIPVVILKCLKNEPIPIYGKGDNIRDWLYVEDHVKALMAVLEGGTPGETYNVGGNNELQNIELVRMLCQILDEELEKRRPEAGVSEGTNAPPLPDSSAENRSSRNSETLPSESLITYVDDRPGHDQRYAIDASKIKRQLGWQPKQDHESGFRKTVQWYLDNESWWQAILDGSYRLERKGLGVAN